MRRLYAAGATEGTEGKDLSKSGKPGTKTVILLHKTDCPQLNVLLGKGERKQMTACCDPIDSDPSWLQLNCLQKKQRGKKFNLLKIK